MLRLIIFGEDWGQHPSSTQHLAKHLQAFHCVTWVNSVGMRAPQMNKRDIVRCINKLKSMFGSAPHDVSKEQLPPPFEIINPVVLPWHNQLLVNQINQRQIDTALGPRIPGEKRIYWVTVPTAMSMITHHPDDKIVYYCGDDFYALDGVDETMIARWEPKLIERAAVIFAASQTLHAKFPSDKTVLLEHGVDYELFTTPTQANSVISTANPTVGFYGSISKWIDIDLLCYLAEHRPHFTIMLVGPIKTDVSRLQKYPNVVFINAVEHAQLPTFAQHWHALLMPFVKNQQIEACNPLKLREYLACGQPIVSTDFPAAQSYEDVINVSLSKSGFLDGVTEAVNLAVIERVILKKQQQRRVACHDWSQRANQVHHLLQTLYAM